jgi:hypothetical protein
MSYARGALIRFPPLQVEVPLRGGKRSGLESVDARWTQTKVALGQERTSYNQPVKRG